MAGFSYPFYIKDADPEGVAEVYAFLRPFYDRYPSGKEVGEALHQVRRELDLIPPEKKHDRHNAKSSAVSASSADLEGHKKPVRRRRTVGDTGTGNSGDETS